MKRTLRKLTLPFLFILSTHTLFSQGLIVNEFSNGPSGTQEYIEYVVVGPTGNENCGPVDIRGWIVDDNNGDFSPGGPGSSRGIASGHVRFTQDANWAAVPTGSIIVVYNDGDPNPSVPANDPDDTSPADGVYIVPVTNATYIENCTSIPNTSNGSYTPCTYTTPASWSRIGMRNSGDAAQARDNAGVYFHGVSYGNTNMNGGPDNLRISTSSGGGRVGYFDNSTSDDFRDVNNFTFGNVPADETPGAANTANNNTWLNFLKTPCILPVRYAQNLEGSYNNDVVTLTWKTASENDNLKFVIERSANGKDGFIIIGEERGQLNSDSEVPYQFVDRNPLQDVSFYRLKEITLNGESHYSNVVEVIPDGALDVRAVYPNPASNVLNFDLVANEAAVIRLYNMMGQEVASTSVDATSSEITKSINISTLNKGVYLYKIYTAGKVFHGKITKN